MNRFTLFLALMIVTPVIGFSFEVATADEDLGSLFIAAFKAECVTDLPAESEIISRAKERKYKPLPANAAAALAPAQKDAEWSGWLVDSGPAPAYFLSVSRGKKENVTFETCGISNPNAPEAEILPKLISDFSLTKPILDSVAPGKITRTRVWNATIENKKVMLIVFTGSESSKEPGVVINISRSME